MENDKFIKDSRRYQNSAAKDFDIQVVEGLLKAKLPRAYKDLLMYTNGFSLGSGVVIYGTEDLVERNETWEVDEYASGYISVGDDSGGNIFSMRQHVEEKQVLLIDAGGLDPNYATLVTQDFSEWVNSGCLLETEQDTIMDLPDTCRILLTQFPSEGLKGLIRIKNGLGIAISTAELLSGSKNPPYTLAERFPSGKAQKLIEKLGSIGTVLTIEPMDENEC